MAKFVAAVYELNSKEFAAVLWELDEEFGSKSLYDIKTWSEKAEACESLRLMIEAIKTSGKGEVVSDE